MKSSDRKRLSYMDLVKGIGIILVIMVHSDFLGERSSAFVTSFYMSVFFVLSGMLASYRGTADMPLKELLRKKAMSLLVPYLAFGILYLILNRIIEKGGSFEIWNALLLNAGSALWFLPALFFGEILLILFVRKRKSLPGLALSAGTGILAMMLHALFFTVPVYESIGGVILLVICRIFAAEAFLSAGFFIFPYFDAFFTEKKDPWALLVGLLLLVLTIPLSLRNGAVDFNRLYFGNPALFLVSSLTGSFGLILLCKGLSGILYREGERKTDLFFRPFLFWGRNSLIIMCTHLTCYILYLSILSAWQLDRYITRAKSYVFMFNIVALTLLMETLLIYIINHYLPFLLGKPCGRRKDS